MVKLKQTHGSKGRIGNSIANRFLRTRAALAYPVRRRKANWTPLFLVGTPRVGSHFLRTFLNSHAEIDLGAEILLPGTFYGLPQRYKGEKVLRHMKKLACLSGGKVRGFKMHFQQLKNRGISLRMMDEAFPQAKYLVLYRRNLFEQACSEALANHLGSWIRRKQGDKVYEPVTIDSEWLQAKIQEYQGAYAALTEEAPWMEFRSLPVCFERLLEDQNGASRELLKFLGLPHQSLSGATIRQRDRPIREYLLNFDELAHLVSPATNDFHFTWKS